MTKTKIVVQIKRLRKQKSKIVTKILDYNNRLATIDAEISRLKWSQETGLKYKRQHKERGYSYVILPACEVVRG